MTTALISLSGGKRVTFGGGADTLSFMNFGDGPVFELDKVRSMIAHAVNNTTAVLLGVWGASSKAAAQVAASVARAWAPTLVAARSVRSVPGS